MMITRDNYEMWFLDYLEEKLDESQKEMIRKFLIANPDLAEGLEAYMPELKAVTPPAYPYKELLKKAVYDDPAILETTAVAALEGDLDMEERDRFVDWLESRPDSGKLTRILEKTKLAPDLQIHFPDKERLKRSTFPSVAWIRIAAAAAVLMLAFFLFYPSAVKEERSAGMNTDSKKIPSQNNPGNEAIAIFSEPAPKKEKIAGNTGFSGSSAAKISYNDTAASIPAATRTFVPVQKLVPRSGLAVSYTTVYADLILIRSTAPVYYASGEIPLADFFNDKLQELKADQPREPLTREVFKVAGLRFFSRIPGNHLTGKKGKDGRLKSISFNTQMLAFSIPVNK